MTIMFKCLYTGNSLSDNIEQQYFTMQSAELETGLQKMAADVTEEAGEFVCCHGPVHGLMKENIAPLHFSQCGQQQLVKRTGGGMNFRKKFRTVEAGAAVHLPSVHDVQCLGVSNQLAVSKGVSLTNATPIDRFEDVDIVFRALDACTACAVMTGDCTAAPTLYNVSLPADTALHTVLECEPVPHETLVVEKFPGFNHLWLLGF